MFNMMTPAQKVIFADAAKLSSINLCVQRHIGNSEIHVTKEDKLRWDSSPTQDELDQMRLYFEQQIEELRALIENS